MVADDLTGACDAGVAFAPAMVILHDEAAEGLADSEARIYTTHSRGEAPDVAAARVAELVKRIAAVAPGVRLYKKIDSVLRGNVREELAAMLAASGRRAAIVCPAFPEQGRTVKHGVAHPPGVSLRGLLEGIAGVEIADATTAADLDRIAREADPETLLVGSAGLARAAGRIPPRKEVPNAPGAGRALVCVGSIHPATIAQVAELTEEDAELWQIDMAAPDPVQLGLLRHRVEALQAGGLVLTGGDTALLVTRLAGAAGIRLEAEIEPGVPFGRLVGGVGAGLAVVTKSGGFGSPSTLVSAARVLSAENRIKG